MDLSAMLRLWEGYGTAAGRGLPDADRYRGVLLGVAVGNLLGIPVEGKSKDRIRQRFPGGLRGIDLSEVHRPWDDDLAQTVVLAEAILAADRLSLEDLAQRLVRWGRQNGRGMGNLTARVLDKLERGVPSALAAQEVWEDDGRGPAGNGAVMRCSPVALRWRSQPALLVEQTLLSARVTHHDPRCQWSAVALNIAMAHALAGQALAPSALAGALEGVGTPAAVTEAIRLVEGSSLDDFALSDRHTMGYTLKAMQVGLWALDGPEGFEETLVSVVNAGGDTDTNGAVAGAALGAVHGLGAIPARWLACVPQRQRLEEMAEQLLAASGHGR
ncbi:MAG: ADP-ribosylglycohydrolase family protein [Chloroflexi bacterium]|nr:ADP-ribosylglycohydrolase family protein [Chloroflexota bacterium]